MEWKMKALSLAHQSLFVLRKKSPEILLGAGIAGTVLASVMACKATLKIHEVEETYNDLIDNIENGRESFPEEEYSEQDYKKDLNIARVQRVVNYGRLYAPSVLAGGTSIALILAGHHIMSRRFFGLAAAYQVIDSAYKNYRQAVIDDQGEDKDREYQFGIKKTVKKTTKTGKDGKKVKSESVTVEVPDELDPAMYAKFFDESSHQWRSDWTQNMFFLNSQQAYANDKLNIEGHLFLNEVYDALGLPRTSYGAIVGWMKRGDGDGYVDFGVYDDRNADFINGYKQDRILLDFNVDGNIWNLI